MLGAAAGAQPCPACEVHRNFGGEISFNVIAQNNFLGCSAFENAALKVHGYSGVVKANLVIDNPYSAGMWFDDLWCVSCPAAAAPLLPPPPPPPPC